MIIPFSTKVRVTTIRLLAIGTFCTLVPHNATTQIYNINKSSKNIKIFKIMFQY